MLTKQTTLAIYLVDSIIHLWKSPGQHYKTYILISFYITLLYCLRNIANVMYADARHPPACASTIQAKDRDNILNIKGSHSL